MKNWQETTLKKVSDKVDYGYTASATDQNTGVKFLRITDIAPSTINWASVPFCEVSEKDLEKYELQKYDIVIARTGATVGYAKLIGEGVPRSIFASYLIRLKIKDGISKKFIGVLVESSNYKYFINTIAGGAAQPNANARDLCSYPFFLPPVQVQDKIAAVLSTYDDLIENNLRRIALLERMAEEIFREWFVRMRFPGYEKVKFEKGVPDRWQQKRFGAFCVLQRGHDLPDDKVEPGPYPVAASTSIKTYHNQYKAKPPVITTGRSGSLGKVLFINEKTWPLNTCLYVKDFCGNSCYLIYYTLKNMGLENFNAGAGVPSLNRNHLNGIPMVVPPKKLQDSFDAIISPLFQQKELIEQSNKLLIKTRDTLLPRLISGKLSVENLEIQFPPSMQDEATS